MYPKQAHLGVRTFLKDGPGKLKSGLHVLTGFNQDCGKSSKALVLG